MEKMYRVAIGGWLFVYPGWHHPSSAWMHSPLYKLSKVSRKWVGEGWLSDKALVCHALGLVSSTTQEKRKEIQQIC